jgi:beta-glucanase (GH16 family)
VEWYFDGKLIQACTEAGRIPTGYHYLLLNLAVSGEWPVGFQNADRCLTSDSGRRFVLAEEAAQDRSTPNPTMDRLGNRRR